jgi:hypothetical protein
MIFRTFLGALGLAFSASVLQAQENTESNFPTFLGDGEEIGLIKHSTVLVDDQVDGSCWTNSQAVRSRVYLIFEQSGIFVPDYSPAFFNFQTVQASLEGFGLRNSSGLCVVSASFNVETLVSQKLGGLDNNREFSIRYTARIFERESIFTNGNNVNSQISDFLEGAASEFAAKVLSSRRSDNVQDYYATYPPYSDKPMSEEEFKELINSTGSERSE